MFALAFGHYTLKCSCAHIRKFLLPMLHIIIYVACIALIDGITLFAVCPIKGQIRKECASHPSCHQACNDTCPSVCPQVCIINGCECPAGTVIDWERGECVRPNQCEGRQAWLLHISYADKT